MTTVAKRPGVKALSSGGETFHEKFLGHCSTSWHTPAFSKNTLQDLLLYSKKQVRIHNVLKMYDDIHQNYKFFLDTQRFVFW